ncbi:MAG: PKD domain-containing protein [Chitinophagaceae bacterium]|nr:PKD domain-containing protein [Chitinophagaceae bacterium]MBL0054930.1 PKD domain-containing protein [Chitinophagaceae bacterium]
MKKMFTLLWITLTAFAFSSKAQTTTCNAEFTWQYINANTVKFTPVMTDSPLVTHQWVFGDGTPNSNQVSPTHNYVSGGAYTVVHTIVRRTPNGTPVCTQSITKTIIIQLPCTLVVDFSWTATAANPLTLQFHNLSTPLEPSDSTTWTFGDGTNSYAPNPVHTYANAGTYTVCLVVKKNFNTPGTTPCIRYICKTVVVSAPCTLQPNFSWTATATNPLRIEFQNTTPGLAVTDSSIWNFGDGTSSTAVNPTHTYTAAGTYNVCLTVKRFNGAGTTPCIRTICKTVVVTAPCTLVVDFNWSITQTNPLRYEFHNLSTPLAPSDSTIWTFGDGTGSLDVNPVHTYAQAGTYTVCLKVVKSPTPNSTPCVRYICKTIVVTAPCTLVVDFNWTIASTNPLRYEFQNLSTPLSPSDSTIWNFGDGTTSYAVNPVHTYANAGTYNVCLIVKKFPFTSNTPCIRYKCKTVVVQAPCNLVANFTWQPDANNAQLIHFTNTSTPVALADSIRWTFGDGSSSNQMNPDHAYAQPGTYTVCLRVARPTPAGSAPCVREICKTITVHPSCNTMPSWTWQIDPANPLNVIFTNTTISPTAGATAIWSFGDGTTANTWNATHTYTQPGRYYVCLRITFSNTCIKYKCDTINIPVPPPPCNNQSNFTFVATSSNSQTLTFIPAYQSPNAVYTWTFGDGTGSHDMIATHHYANPGTYTACLTVWRSATCASTTCKTVQVVRQVNCDSVHVNFTYQRDPNVPNKLYFAANSNFPILDQTWTITRLVNNQSVTLHQNNPSYLFPDTGMYRVCLRAVTLGGCIKEVCQYIRIERTGGTNACTLQAYPNPASSIVSVNVSLTAPEMINVYIYNSSNVLVLQRQQQGVVGANVVTTNIANLLAGQYVIKLIYGNHVCYGQFQKL